MTDRVNTSVEIYATDESWEDFVDYIADLIEKEGSTKTYAMLLHMKNFLEAELDIKVIDYQKINNTLQ